MKILLIHKFHYMLGGTEISQKLYEFKVKLQAKCNENSIELRVVVPMVSIVKDLSSFWLCKERLKTF